MHVSFIHILLPQFLMDGLNDIIFELGHLYVCLRTLNARARAEFWNLWAREGFRCTGYYGCLTDISVGCPNITLQILHNTGELVRVFLSNIEDITLYVTSLDLDAGLGFKFQTLVFVTFLLTYVPLGIGFLSLVFVSRVIQLVSFRGTLWFSFEHPLQSFLTLMLFS